MKSEDVADVAFVVFWLVILSIIGGVICYDAGHGKGYEKGAEHAQLYYEQVGEFPSQDWYGHTEALHLDSGSDIEQTLERYKPTKYK